MNSGFGRHFPEAVWEEYALGGQSEEDCQRLEEHLLICSKCQDLLAKADEYVQVTKAALARSTALDRRHGPIFPATQPHRRFSKPAKAAAAVAGSLLWLT